ncbi:nuclear transport factor 2 family protein [Pollutibacter soli]|uniref:nuclear transport factor 2 family protein n=1 Tax=Pollutibacter soli TaxID=3034157 RepID=UPI003013D4CE
MKKILFCACSALIFLACNSDKGKEVPTAAAPAEAAPATTKTLPTEIGDDKYVAIGKSGLDNLSSGNIDAWTNMFADNARYYWNGGDSLIGKQAIATYWKKRRMDAIDSITFNTPIFLSVKVNEQQQPQHTKGNWLLSWYRVEAKYKASGKKMTQWVHTDMHFDASDKVDQVVQYIDRTLVAAAEKKK